jgi:hypothetical protein
MVTLSVISGADPSELPTSAGNANDDDKSTTYNIPKLFFIFALLRCEL